MEFGVRCGEGGEGQTAASWNEEEIMSSDRFSLEGRGAIVTGGNRGLGRAIALGFAAAGTKVCVTGRNPEQNRIMADELGDADLVFQLDVRDEETVRGAVDRAVERMGGLDILVNNAGHFLGGSVMELSREDWDEVIGTHLTGTFLSSKYAARAMKLQGQGGKIIHVGSMYSIFGAPRGHDYTAAKTGILGLTRSMAVELGDCNIQVNAILPGLFVTDTALESKKAPMAEEMRRKTPARRLGMPEDLVGTAVFLASKASDFVTGACIPVDGGYSICDRMLPQ